MLVNFVVVSPKRGSTVFVTTAIPNCFENQVSFVTTISRSLPTEPIAQVLDARRPSAVTPSITYFNPSSEIKFTDKRETARDADDQVVLSKETPGDADNLKYTCKRGSQHVEKERAMSTAPSFGIGPGIGKTVLVKGNLLSGEDLTIDGQVEGTIDLSEHRLTIAPNGTVQANVNARDIEIWGSLEGKLEAVDKVYIRKGGKFVGDIHSAGIVIEEGGYIRGSIDLSRHPAHQPTTGDGSNPTDSYRNSSKAGPIRQLSVERNPA